MQYRQNIVNGPQSAAEARFQKVLGAGVIAMVAAPIVLPLATAAAPILSEAALVGSIKAYGVATAASGALATEAGYLWNAGKEVVGRAVDNVSLPHLVNVAGGAKDLLNGYFTQEPPANLTQGVASGASYIKAIMDYYGVDIDQIAVTTQSVDHSSIER